MPSLPDELFKPLEKAVLEARAAAEEAAQAAITALAVNRATPFGTLDPAQRRLRNALRARARQLGDGSQHRGLPILVEEIAYQQWHRMLFARFLAENGLLMHPTGVPVTLQDCAELGPEEGELDAWSLAARYASAMLPGIFRNDDPVVQVRFAPEGRLRLERILTDMPAVVFTADDGLGWMYQFWQAQKKAEVNASERKIGGADIAPVTQLFTEDYMVRFLLENSLGAWWVARHPDSPLGKTFTYLRFREDGTPAAGTFPGWPDRAAEITVMDPCCGSGHFLVVAFEMLCLMRMEEEGLDEARAADAVLRDNLFGLELDPRCTQIAAFALALAAWKFGGYRELPVPNVACSGIPVEGQLETWTKLAGDDANLRATLERLYHLFKNAPELGSLINPSDVPVQARMFAADYTQVQPLLDQALLAERASEDPSAIIFGTAAAAVARAARLLAGTYTLVATNVPYLTRNKQAYVLRQFCDQYHPRAKADLATAFVERCRTFTEFGGSAAIVTPQNWLSLITYRRLRSRMLREQSWHHVSWLGPGAFETISGEVVKPIVLILSNSSPRAHSIITGINASNERGVSQKAAALRKTRTRTINQLSQLRNPDARIILGETVEGPLLQHYAASLQGISPADLARFGRFFWEVRLTNEWHFWQGSPEETIDYGGRSRVLWWCQDLLEAVEGGSAYIRGQAGWGRRAIAVRQVGHLPCTLYTGEKADTNVAIIVPRDPALLAAIWAYCRSPEFHRAVRKIDKKLNVTNSTLVKVPFDVDYWQRVAEASGPLPMPSTNDPTQWLFGGHPVDSSQPLQVAVARLLGYPWPQQEPDDLGFFVDEDGIVCLAPVAGEQPAAERLRALLVAAYGENWSPARQEELLAAVGFSGKTLDVWLRDGFFSQHCKLFKNRPFIWHIWDGRRRDGFSALVNYHKLDAALLDKLIYTYLGAWIKLQRGKRDAGEPGAEGRLVAALELQKKLEAIRDGEPPHDIYVRWKPLHEQPIGWSPDLNDGVRLNIRPFVTAGVLRRKFTIHWKKDRGKNPDGSERINNLHFTIAEKLAAREK